MAYGAILGQSLENSPVLDNYFTKDETLTNATAALFGLGADAVPDDVLNKLSSLSINSVSGIYSGPATFADGVIDLGFKPTLVIIYSSYNNEQEFGPANNWSQASTQLDLRAFPIILSGANSGGSGYQLRDNGFSINAVNDDYVVGVMYIAFR